MKVDELAALPTLPAGLARAVLAMAHPALREGLLMPRGFKLDTAETKAAYACGAFTDKKKRSFVGRKPDGSLHLMLAGQDKMRMHDEIMTRDRGMCRSCPIPHYIGPFGEWDHERHQNWNRCDCKTNGRCVCNWFHVRRHRLNLKEKFEKCPGVESFAGREVAA